MNDTASRLLSATSLAVVGDAAAAARVIEANRAIGFSGPIWPVHPNLQTVAGLPAVAGVHDLPQAPDAAFVAVPARACPAEGWSSTAQGSPSTPGRSTTCSSGW
jgi:acyl-CoA synthetase (NDP forming)